MTLADRCICTTEAKTVSLMCSERVCNMRELVAEVIVNMSQFGCKSDIQTFLAEACDILDKAESCFDMAASIATTEVHMMNVELDKMGAEE